MEDQRVYAVGIDRKTRDVHYTLLSKAVLEKMKEDGTASWGGADKGLNEYPFNPSAVTKTLVANPYHSTCIQAKVNASVGLGFLSDDERKNGPTSLNSAKVSGALSPEEVARNSILNPLYLPSEVDTALDGLCEFGWNDLLTSVAYDFVLSGNGYIEVSRDASGKVLKLWHVPFGDIKAFIEDEKGKNFHYRVTAASGKHVPIARWGDRKDMVKRFKQGADAAVLLTGYGTDEISERRVHEVIHLRNPMGMHRVYGFPSWMSAVPAIELIQAMMQFKYDFFLNRCVPEYMLFITGGALDDDDWKKVTDAIKDNTGLGNSHKSIALNLSQADITVKLEKLGSDTDKGIFQDKEQLQADIVTAHRVPPLLANILIPGKLGATNEFPNALMSFQLLSIHPTQRIVQSSLGRTLGSAEAGLGLEANDFILRKVTDLIDVNKADTISRMRETVPEAQAKGRNLDEGVRD